MKKNHIGITILVFIFALISLAPGQQVSATEKTYQNVEYKDTEIINNSLYAEGEYVGETKELLSFDSEEEFIAYVDSFVDQLEKLQINTNKDFNYSSSSTHVMSSPYSGTVTLDRLGLGEPLATVSLKARYIHNGTRITSRNMYTELAGFTPGYKWEQTSIRSNLDFNQTAIYGISTGTLTVGSIIGTDWALYRTTVTLEGLSFIL